MRSEDQGSLTPVCTGVSPQQVLGASVPRVAVVSETDAQWEDQAVPGSSTDSTVGHTHLQATHQ